MKPSISVIIPAFNCAGTLPEAIGSVVSQSWQDLEIIVIDDGSTDGTPEVLSRSCLPIDVRLRQKNGGPASARNSGIEAARGEWIAFLDADDVWMPGKLEAQMSMLSRDPSLEFVYSDSIMRSPDGTESLKRPRGGECGIFYDLLLGSQFSTGTVIVRRHCFEEFGLFDTQMRTGEDWDMWLRLAAGARGAYVPQSLLTVNLRWTAEKYPLRLLERCTLRVLDRLFSRPETSGQWRVAMAQRRRVYSWHYSVLAKSYFSQGQLVDFLRLGTRSILSHPAGFSFLARRWDIAGRWPDVAKGAPAHGINPRKCT